jgi:hypothetical protein
MAAGATYEPIATTTLSSNTTGVSFTSISGAYTDLIFIGQLKYVGAAQAYAGVWQVNSTSGTSYSETILYGTGTSALSSRTSNDAAFRPREIAANASSSWTMLRIDFLNYSNTSINKTVLTTLSSDRNGAGEVSRQVGLFRSTSAITSIQFDPFSIGFVAGSTFTLYGIKSA